MKCLANEPYNCLTTETYDGKLHIILEKYPFHPETGKLTRKTLHAVDDAAISLEDLGVGDEERINYLFYRTDAVVLFGESGGSPLQYWTAIQHDAESIPKHGFLPFYPKSNFAPPGHEPLTNANPDTLQAVRDRTLELWNRHKHNHELESGHLVIKGNPAIKAGDGILTSDNMEYLVETVADHYVWGHKYTTNLQVTRGQDHGRS